MKKPGFVTVLTGILALVGVAASIAAAPRTGDSVRATESLPDLAKAGKKNPLPDGGWFTWEWATAPKMGTAILKVALFAKDGARSTALEIVGDSGMPSMPGAHDSGPVAFKLNKKGDYLLPVNIVMPGDWQVVVRLERGEETVFEGRIRFGV